LLRARGREVGGVGSARRRTKRSGSLPGHHGVVRGVGSNFGNSRHCADTALPAPVTGIRRNALFLSPCTVRATYHAMARARVGRAKGGGEGLAPAHQPRARGFGKKPGRSGYFCIFGPAGIPVCQPGPRRSASALVTDASERIPEALRTGMGGGGGSARIRDLKAWG